ncbi:MAG: hypothetical protein QM607_02980 [Microbacterium sp.]
MSARARLQLLLYFASAAGAIVFGALAYPGEHGATPYLQGPIMAILFFAVTLLPTVAAVVALFSLPAAMWVQTATGLAYALALVLWLPSMDTANLPAGLTPWTFNVSTSTIVCVAVAWTARTTWAFLFATSAVTFVVDQAIMAPPAEIDALLGTVFSLTLSALFVLLIRRGLDSGVIVDRSARVAREAAELAARTRGTFDRRQRLNALVHDHVLSLLLVASRAGDEARAQLRAGAHDVFRDLELSNEDGWVSAEELLARVRALAPSDFRWRGEATDGAGVPTGAANAIVDASAEAIRNSMLHAGDADRSIEASATRNGVRVVIADDGAGFALARTAPERMGVRVSIIDRMVAVGGKADVRSRPGDGTEVEVSWSAPE